MNTLPTRSGCSACGTSPVNHTFFRFFTTVDEVLDKVIRGISTRVSLPHEEAISDTLYTWVTLAFHAFGLARFSNDKSKVASGRSELIWDEAERRGILMEQVVFLGKPIEQYRARINTHWFYFDSIPIPPSLVRGNYSWVDDKLALVQKLEQGGFPVPKTRSIASWRTAERAFTELSKPVIIKPRRGSRGRHTTTHVETIAELRAAYALAKEIARELLIEEHLFGSVYRATVVDGKLVGFFRGDPPQVHGDGSKTVTELIREKNENKHERLGDIQITADLTSFIGRKGYSLYSVLPNGVVLDLSAKTGRFYGGYTKEMLPEVHPKMHTVFADIAKLIESPVVGFDLISANPTADPDKERWGIIECNSLPFIDLHYYALEGEPIDIAPHIWDLWK